MLLFWTWGHQVLYQKELERALRGFIIEEVFHAILKLALKSKMIQFNIIVMHNSNKM